MKTTGNGIDEQAPSAVSKGRVRDELRLNEERLRLATEAADIGIWDWTIDDDSLYWSEKCNEIFGFPDPPPTDYSGFLAIVVDEDRERVRQTVQDCLDNRQDYLIEFRIRITDGTERWISAAGRLYASSEANPRHLGGVIQDISTRRAMEAEIRSLNADLETTVERRTAELRTANAAQREALEHIQYLAYFDRLTDLPNRIGGQDRLVQTIERTLADGKRLAVVFLDLVKFKYFNDTHGSEVGDQLLQQVAVRLQESLGQQGFVCRLSSDEFMLVWDGLDPARLRRQVIHRCEQLLRDLEPPFLIQDLQLYVNVRCGIAVFPDHGRGAEALMRHANVALGVLQHGNDEGYRLFEPRMDRALRRFVETRDALRKALDRDEFELYYQPQIDLATCSVIGAEALLRWRHPSLGLQSPDQFLNTAEESGLIVPIGQWALDQACRQAQRWHHAGWKALSIAVNLSAIQFRQGGLEHQIETALSKSGLDPSYLVLELTESILLQDETRIRTLVEGWKALGIQLAIDDFGTGYSSLAYLKRFRVDKLKIDREFVRDMETDAEDRAIVRAIVQIAQSLGLGILAEGVETEPQAEQLRDLGCNLVQGYLYAQPLPAKAFTPWLRDWTNRQMREG